MSDLSFPSRFANNAVIVIDALGADDMQTAQRLEENLADLRHADGSPYCHIVKSTNKKEFLAALDTVHAQCLDGLRPIIHIEGHGEKELGIHIADSNEFVSWPELESRLAAINTATKNNCGVVMAACFGLYAISPLRIEKPCPYYFLIGPDQDVPAGYIDDQMQAFYRILFDQRSLDEAMRQVDGKFKQFHSEQFFVRVFSGYLKKGSRGKGAAQRVERLVSQRIEAGLPRNRETLRKLRKEAKAFVKPSSAAYHRRARLFLHGRVPVAFDKVLAFVSQNYA